MPSGFSLESAGFSTFWAEEFIARYATIIVPSSSVNGVTLDGELLSESLFSIFDTYPYYAFVRVEIAQGAHQLACPRGFQGYVFGYSEGANSYVIPYNGNYASPVLGCVDEGACNYDPSANTDDRSCKFPFPSEDGEGNCLQDEG